MKTVAAAVAGSHGNHRKRHHEEDHEEHVNHERWLITYADMITLLMVLFIVLFSMGQTDLAKFEALKASLAQGFGPGGGPLDGGGTSVLDGGLGPLDGGSGVDPDVSGISPADKALAREEARERAFAREQERLGATEQQIQAALDAVGLGDAVEFRHEARGLVVVVATDKVLFDVGQAHLRAEGLSVLDQLAPALRNVPNTLSVEGHTDSTPLNGGALFATNWELSTARATTVLRHFVDRHGFDAGRLSAAGYADQRPLSDNASDNGRRTNRRVEVVVLAQAPAPQEG